MANKVFNMAGGRHSAAAYSAFEDALYGSCVATDSDFVATAGTGMTVQLTSGDGLISTGSGYARRIQADAVNTITITAASATLKRIDAIVAYIDNAVTPTTNVTDNTNDILKFIAVAGTPASSPTAPSAVTIQSAVGAGNPYMVLWEVTIPAGATALNAATFTDKRTFAGVSDGSITTDKLEDGAVTTDKIGNGAVTTAKLDAEATGMVYLGKVSLSADSNALTINLGTTYDNYRVIGCGAMATGSNTYIDLQMLDGSTPINNYHQVQRVVNTTWSSEIVQDATYANNTYSVNASEGFQFEMNVYRSGTNWTKYDCTMGSGGGLAFHTAIANGRNVNATKPTGFKLATGGTFTAGSWIKVWGWNN